jgi:ParB family chromosome partitioning protein
MGLFDKILAKRKADKDYLNYDETENVEVTEPTEEETEDFPLSPVIFDDETAIAPKISHKRTENTKNTTEEKKNPYYREVELSLKELLGRPVKISEKQGKGTLCIEFYNQEDLKNLALKFE